jgi:hypothetical protein
MGGQSFSPNGKTGSPGKHYARWSCEIADENKPLFKGKTYSRELLASYCFLISWMSRSSIMTTW